MLADDPARPAARRARATRVRRTPPARPRGARRGRGPPRATLAARRSRGVAATRATRGSDRPRDDVGTSSALVAPGRLPSTAAGSVLDGIPGSVLTGPFPVGDYAAALRDRLRGFTRVQVFGEVFGFKAGRAKVWFELRDAAGALPCSMWREDFEKLSSGSWRTARRSSSRAAATTTRARARRRRGSRSRSRGCASPARATCWPSSSSCGATARRRAVRAAEDAHAARAAALHRRRDRGVGQGARRRAGRPAPPRLGGPARVGLRARAGPPRGAGDHAARCRTSRRARRSR